MLQHYIFHTQNARTHRLRRQSRTSHILLKGLFLTQWHVFKTGSHPPHAHSYYLAYTIEGRELLWEAEKSQLHWAESEVFQFLVECSTGKDRYPVLWLYLKKKKQPRPFCHSFALTDLWDVHSLNTCRRLNSSKDLGEAILKSGLIPSNYSISQGGSSYKHSHSM